MDQTSPFPPGPGESATQPPPAPKTEGRGKHLIILLLVLIPILTLVFPALMERVFGGLMGYGEVVMAKLNACSLATDRLGTPIGRSWMGWSCGSAESGGAFGQATWSMPVSGPSGRGTYKFVAENRGQGWKLLQGDLETGGEHIDVMQCALASGQERPEQKRMVEGTVETAIGAVETRPGTRCRLDIGPGDGPYGCRLKVDCGGTVLYGARDTSGYVRCRISKAPGGGEVVSALDSEDGADGDDPALELKEAEDRLVISDHASEGFWVLEIRLDGAPVRPPSPDVLESPLGPKGAPPAGGD